MSPPTISGDSYWYDSGTHVTLILDGSGAPRLLSATPSYPIRSGEGPLREQRAAGTVTVLNALSIASPQSITTTSTVQYDESVGSGGARRRKPERPPDHDPVWRFSLDHLDDHSGILGGRRNHGVRPTTRREAPGNGGSPRLFLGA